MIIHEKELEIKKFHMDNISLKQKLDLNATVNNIKYSEQLTKCEQIEKNAGNLTNRLLYEETTNAELKMNETNYLLNCLHFSLFVRI
jgi:hypothetical protein